MLESDWQWRGVWYVYSTMTPRREGLLFVAFSYGALCAFTREYLRPGEGCMHTRQAPVV